ncbi:winged helix-turn-helix transcriptional regulator [Pantoea sp. LMR881]|uniref:winged helix-turn-helix transcriptional regulator n=1 Tax=Pantoea sp. LMR881 TaxID=3014336 RepID=UPI003FA6F061
MADWVMLISADAVGLSPSPCLQRVKRLEQAGDLLRVMKQYINLTKITDSVTVFNVSDAAGISPRRFYEVWKMPYVMWMN